MARALLLYGGWEGHRPASVAEFAAHRLLSDCDVVAATDLEMLRPDVLSTIDLLVPVWTFGELGDSRVEALVAAVEHGLGMVTWHGAASSFLDSRTHKLLLGGQFVGHPGGNDVTYTVSFSDDPLVAGLDAVTVTSEQYYLLVDPAVDVLASAPIDGGGMEWLAGVRMPVMWKRRWGRGRVFYSSLGHTLEVLEHPSISAVLRRAVTWAARGSAQPY